MMPSYAKIIYELDEMDKIHIENFIDYTNWFTDYTQVIDETDNL